MLHSTQRGHEIVFSDGDNWFYADNGESASIDRPCIRCGRMPTAEGHDACVGEVTGAKSVCCGHGVTEPILIMDDVTPEDGERTRFDSDHINPCSCGAQPVIKRIGEKHFKYAAYCTAPFLQCQDWPAHFGVTREEAIAKWNDAHPIETKDMEGNDNAPR